MKLNNYHYGKPNVSKHKDLYYIDYGLIEVHIRNKYSRTGQFIEYAKLSMFNYKLKNNNLLFKKYTL